MDEMDTAEKVALFSILVMSFGFMAMILVLLLVPAEPVQALICPKGSIAVQPYKSEPLCAVEPLETQP